MQHLFAGCSFSRQVWREVLSWCRSTTSLLLPEDDFMVWLTMALCLPSQLPAGLELPRLSHYLVTLKAP